MLSATSAAPGEKSGIPFRGPGLWARVLPFASVAVLAEASLVDAVMDLPDVQDSARLEASMPLGDSETLGRLRERTEDASTRAAGASALLDADIPAPPGAEGEPG